MGCRATKKCWLSGVDVHVHDMVGIRTYLKRISRRCASHGNDRRPDADKLVQPCRQVRTWEATSKTA